MCVGCEGERAHQKGQILITHAVLRFPSEDGEVDPKREAQGPPRRHFIYFKILPRTSSGITTKGNEQECRQSRISRNPLGRVSHLYVATVIT